MKISDYKRSIKAKLSKRIFMNLGIFSSFLLVTLLSLYAWSPAKQSSAFDWNTVDGASPYVASLSGDDEIRISATPSASQAVFDQDDVLELTSTCPYGAAIYLNMDSSESNALSRTGSDEGIKTISATTGTALNDNSWGYSLDDGSTYLPMPLSTGTPVNIYNSEQVESNTEITVKYGMKIDSSIPSGYYSGNVLYSIVTNPSCAKYTLTFDTDGGTPIEDVLLTYGQTIDLPDYATTRDDYVFDGWELTGSISTTYDGTETDVDVNPGNSLTVELKAKWVSAKIDIFKISSMQEMTYEVCENTTTPLNDASGIDTTGEHRGDNSFVPSKTLVDTRDNSSYTVRKLADGRCWMTENLRIINKTISSEDSNLPPGETYAVPASNNASFGYTYNVDSAYLDSTYGGYYSFYAATAGKGGTSLASGNATGDICPKGWRLPTGGDTGEYQTLYDQYSSSALMQGAPGITLSGFMAGDHLMYAQGSSGEFWSSTTYNANKAYALDIDNSYVEPYFELEKYEGFPVRCIGKPRRDIFTITKMQEMTPEVCNETTTPTASATAFDSNGSYRGNSDYVPRKGLKDTRTNYTFNVAKLADGNCWMTQNLSIENKEITSEDSDMNSLYANDRYRIPASASASSASSSSRIVNAGSSYGYGLHYNYGVATLTSAYSSPYYTFSDSSICPKGWRLPTALDETSDYQRLASVYSPYALVNGPANFTPLGYWTGNGISGYNTLSTYKSSTGSALSGQSTSKSLYINTSNWAVSYNFIEYNPVRCIADRRYKISLDADGGSVFPSSVRASNGSTLALPTPTTSDGRVFVGWYTSAEGGVKIQADKDDWSSDMTLYAHWVTAMQSFDKNTMLLNAGDSMSLVDTRDGNNYTVKRLADGNVWMTENLRIEDKTITSDDSNLPSGESYTIPASDLSSFTTAYNTNSAYVDSTYGGYYNFYTATAGWGTDSVTSGNSPKDICPKGWRLPTGGSSGEFQALYNNYNSITLMQGEPSFTLSGYVRDGSVYDQDSVGYFWSSTVRNARNAYFLFLNSPNVLVTYTSKNYGFSVRCIAQ